MLKRHINIISMTVLAGLILLQAAFLFSDKGIQTYSTLLIISSFYYIFFILLLSKIDISKKQLLFVLISLFLLKMVFVNTEPIGSDDYYRYIWDAKVQVNGINPYLYSPNDSTLTSLHSKLLPANVSYPEIKTIYFPVSQWLFMLAYMISGENSVGLKMLYLLFELATLIALYFLLVKFSINMKYILIYAALPLITFQFFIDAHVDIVGVSLMIVSLALYFYNKKFLSYVFIGLSISVKPTALLLIPFYFQNEINTKQKFKSIAYPIVVFLITFLPYILTAIPLETLINYTVNWTFNGMIYNTLQTFISDNALIRILCGILYLFVFFFLFIKRVYLINKIYLSIFLLMIFSPVVHPWYLIWFAVLLPLVRSYSGICFVSVVSLTYFSVIAFQVTGIWKEYPWVLLAEYIPILIIFYYEIKQKKFSNVQSLVPEQASKN